MFQIWKLRNENVIFMIHVEQLSTSCKSPSQLLFLHFAFNSKMTSVTAKLIKAIPDNHQFKFRCVAVMIISSRNHLIQNLQFCTVSYCIIQYPYELSHHKDEQICCYLHVPMGVQMYWFI